MFNKDILRQITIKQKQDLNISQNFVKRQILTEIDKWMKDSRVLIITGIRRCGKSTILKQLMKKQEKYCYFNFEDERLLDFKAQDFESLNEILQEFYGESNTYFFDEIQNIDKFETFVRRLQDEGKKIIITGSNARLMSKEFGTRLTGRYKAFEIYPFSFQEFLEFKQIKTNKEDFYILEKKVKLKKLFEEYIETGGFPEYLKNKDDDYIKTIYENILYKDVITRYSLKKEKTIKELVSILATNISSRFTYNALKNSLNLSNSITIKEYISYLNNSYMFFELQKFSYSIKNQTYSPRKIYLIDPAFHLVCGSNFSSNKGKLLENSIFLELKMRNLEINYYYENKECNFLIKKNNKVSEAIQVSWNLNQNKEREIQGLIEAMKKFKLEKGLIITHEQEEELEKEGKKIKIIPAYKWFLT